MGLDANKCYACIQWDGHRELDASMKKVRVDTGREGNCRLWHQMRKGTQTCDKFSRLK